MHPFSLIISRFKVKRVMIPGKIYTLKMLVFMKGGMILLSLQLRNTKPIDS